MNGPCLEKQEEAMTKAKRMVSDVRDIRTMEAADTLPIASKNASNADLGGL